MTNEPLGEKKQIERIAYRQAYELAKEEVDRTLSTSPFIIREYMKHLALSEGKHIRALSLLIAALDQDDLIHKDAVKLAAAIEILHLATLVHDDVIDNAEIRRGELSLQKKYGKRTAVICGDYLLCIALRMASLVEDKDEYARRRIPDYMTKICMGELSQHVNNGNFELSAYRYLKIIAGKTAALFEAAFHAGSVLSVKEESKVKQYARLGKYIGMIFQLKDDCIDFESTEQIAKKPVKSDYEQNVITLPLIYAFRQEQDFKERAKAGEVTREDIDRTVRKTGGLNFTQLVAKKYYQKSRAVLDLMELTDFKRERLLAILDQAYRSY